VLPEPAQLALPLSNPPFKTRLVDATPSMIWPNPGVAVGWSFAPLNVTVIGSVVLPPFWSLTVRLKVAVKVLPADKASGALSNRPTLQLTLPLAPLVDSLVTCALAKLMRSSTVKAPGIPLPPDHTADTKVSDAV